MMDQNDTDTLIALVSSLLTLREPAGPDKIMDALIRYEGNPEAAAQFLNSTYKSERGQKRKRVDLDSWLKPQRTKSTNAEKDDNNSSSSKQRSVTSLNNPGSSTGSPSKPTVNLMTVLRQAPPGTKATQSLPPLFLSTPSLVAQHTPCTLHLSILPPEVACRLFYAMIDASRQWKRNKWWLFDRLVESPHRTSFYVRKYDTENDSAWEEAAQFWYNGRPTEPPLSFPPEMEEACKVVEQIVNAELKKRKRYPLEWGMENENASHLPWQANVAASNCYEGSKESVGSHSDQLTYLGPYPTIASLSLGTRRIFSLRESISTNKSDVRNNRTLNIPLPHNSLTVMHGSCQERFKHSIPPQRSIDLFHPGFPKSSEEEIIPSNCRINITFRFYRPDFHPKSIPRCKCGVPTILRADMKNKHDGKTDRYWWVCYAGAQNEGKGCNFWKVLDMVGEGRGAGFRR